LQPPASAAPRRQWCVSPIAGEKNSTPFRGHDAVICQGFHTACHAVIFKASALPLLTVHKKQSPILRWSAVPSPASWVIAPPWVPTATARLRSFPICQLKHAQEWVTDKATSPWRGVRRRLYPEGKPASASKEGGSRPERKARATAPVHAHTNIHTHVHTAHTHKLTHSHMHTHTHTHARESQLFHVPLLLLVRAPSQKKCTWRC